MSPDVNENKWRALQKKMSSVGIFEEDLEEKFVLSSGKGGQKVNKASTCVYLKHIPSGIQVKCQKERSQAQNRFLARQILVNKFEAIKQKNQLETQKELAKIKRQRRKRPRHIKIEILRQKRIRSEKKKMRTFRKDKEE